MAVSFSAATHPGIRRQNNEDSYCTRPDLGLFVVADGVGGYAAGEVASHAAVDAITQAIENTAGCTEQSVWPFEYQAALGVGGNRLNWAVHLANARLHVEAESGRGRPGMATTVAAVLLEFQGVGLGRSAVGATIGHVGDSRIYRLRQGQLDLLTQDHSWVNEQVRAGALAEADVRAHPKRNLLTRAITGRSDPVVELGWVPVAPGDRLLLCTDGLHAVLSDAEILGILELSEGEDAFGEQARIPSDDATVSDGTVSAATASRLLAGERLPALEQVEATSTESTRSEATVRRKAAAPTRPARISACESLVNAANLGGGPDNVTVVLIRI